jgi:hypothetical protein
LTPGSQALSRRGSIASRLRLRGELDENVFSLCPPVHFPEQNAEMFRFGVRPMALFDRLSNLPVAMFQPLSEGFHLCVLLWKWGNEIAPAIAASNG